MRGESKDGEEELWPHSRVVLITWKSVSHGRSVSFIRPHPLAPFR